MDPVRTITERMTDSEQCRAPVATCCRDCGQSQRMATLKPGMVARCRRCNAVLARPWADPLDFGLAVAAASLLLFAGGMVGDLAVVEAAGQRRTATLIDGPHALVSAGLWELAVPVVIASIAAPAAVIGLRLYTILGLRMRRPPPGLRTAFRLHNALRPWAMVEVFIVGYFVAYSKLGALVHIEPDTGFYALFAFMITMVAYDALVEPATVWDAIDRRDPIDRLGAAPRASAPGRDVVACETCGLACTSSPEATAHVASCPRCGAAQHRRKPDSLARTAALAAAGLVLYVPANVFPVLSVVQLGRGSPSTILGGVWELAAADEFPLAAIVFLASIAVPVFKLLALAAMLLVAVRGRTRRMRELTGLYRIVVMVGRWSMIDIFMESILGSLVQFGAVTTIQPGGGAIAFAAVVVLTMFAAEAFDPRLMWDRVAP